MGLLTANETAAMPQEQANDMDGEENRKATPEEQQHYKLVVVQLLDFLTGKGSKGMLSALKADPVQAIVGAIDAAVQAIQFAAQKNGAQLQGHTIKAAVGEATKVYCRLLASMGIIGNADELASQVLQQAGG